MSDEVMDQVVDEDEGNVELTVDYSALSVLGEKLYANNPCWILPRELLQNALDAGATHINVTATRTPDYNLQLTFDDDGVGIQSFMYHFFKLGGSNKRGVQVEGTPVPIGGYGIGAKFTVMGTLWWEAESKNYKVNKQIMMEHGKMIKQDYRKGFKITVVIHSAKVPYHYNALLLQLFENTICDAEITLNGSVVVPAEVNEVVLSNDQVLNKISADRYAINGGILVRVNGLPMFTRSLTGYEAYVMDYTLTGDPYSDTYALSANRESFTKGSMEDSRLTATVEYLNLQYMLQQGEEQKKKYAISSVNGVPSMFVDQLDPTKCIITRIAKVEKMMKQLLDLFSYSGKVHYGWTGEYGNMITLVKMDILPVPYIMVNPEEVVGKSDYELLSSLTHIAVHLAYDLDGHYESFADRLTSCMAVVLEAVVTRKIRF
jgi:hypothetical protein